MSFLYSGPAINILAIVLSYKIFGWKLGAARMIGAIVFAFVIGLLMQLFFRKEDEARLADERLFQYQDSRGRSNPWADDRVHGVHDRHPGVRQLGSFQGRERVLGLHLSL